MAKEFWLVLSGHILINWDADQHHNVGIIVPEMHGHDFKVWGDQPGNPHQYDLPQGPVGLRIPGVDPMPCPVDETRHFTIDRGMVDVTGDGRTRFHPFPPPRPEAIYPLVGRQAKAHDFLNGTHANTVRSPQPGGYYHLVDTSVWKYTVTDAPVLTSEWGEIRAMDLGKAFALVILTAPLGSGHHHHHGHGANDHLRLAGTQTHTTYRFTDDKVTAKTFDNFTNFQEIERFVRSASGTTGSASVRGVMMGSCDQGNTRG